MNIRLFAGPVFAAVLMGAVAVQAQTTAPRATDVGPPPAEERASVGAVVLEGSLVQAQRRQALNESSARTGVNSVGRGVLRSPSRAQVQAELAGTRAAEATELRRLGAGSLTEK